MCLFWTKTLGWLVIVQGHWDVNRKGKVAWFYVHQRGFLCHDLSVLEPSSIFQILPFHVGDHVWCVGSWNIWETGVLGFRWEGVFHPLCWTHGFSHSEIATVWVCSSPGLIGNFCPVEFIGLIWGKKKKRRWWALNRCFKISMIQ